MPTPRATVFVPGFASTQHPGTVQPFLDLLSTLGHDTVYVPSERYMSTAESNTLYPSALWDQVANVIKTMEQRRLNAAFGIGHSLGALILMIAAIERPDLFYHLDLLCPADMQRQTFRQNARGFIRKAAHDIRRSSRREPDPYIRELTSQVVRGSRQYFGEWQTFKRAWREARSLGKGLTMRLLCQWIAQGGSARVFYIEGDLICPISADVLAHEALAKILIKLDMPGHDVHLWPQHLASYYAPPASA